MKCKYCSIDVFESLGTKPRVYCSDRCRKADSRKRTEETDKTANGQVQTDTASTAPPVQCGVMTNTTDPPIERTPGGHIRVSKPGDADYEPQCETTDLSRTSSTKGARL